MDDFVILRASSLAALPDASLRALCSLEGLACPPGGASLDCYIARLQQGGEQAHLPTLLAAAKAQEQARQSAALMAAMEKQMSAQLGSLEIGTAVEVSADSDVDEEVVRANGGHAGLVRSPQPSENKSPSAKGGEKKTNGAKEEEFEDDTELFESKLSDELAVKFTKSIDNILRHAHLPTLSLGKVYVLMAQMFGKAKIEEHKEVLRKLIIERVQRITNNAHA